jgi:hypothetical protein
LIFIAIKKKNELCVVVDEHLKDSFKKSWFIIVFSFDASNRWKFSDSKSLIFSGDVDLRK